MLDQKGRKIIGSLYDDTNNNYYEFSIILLETSEENILHIVKRNIKIY